MTIFGYFIFYLICALNVISGIRKKKSNVLYSVALIVIFILMTFNFDGPDLAVYKATYDLVGNATGLRRAFDLTYMEYGYTLLMFVASRLGLNFYAFRIILTFICLSLFLSTIKYYKANPNFIVGLYMAYIFFFDTIQLRNCIMQFIVLFATRHIFKKSGISVFKYILCIAVAGSMHVLAWIFLSLLLVRLVKRRKGYRIIFGIAALMFIVCVILQPVLPRILNALSTMLNRGSGYFHSKLRFNSWIVLALQLLVIVPLYRYKNRIADEKVRDKIDIILKIKVVTCLFLPLCFINSNFNRVFRNFVVLDTIGLALLYENLKRHTTIGHVSLSAQLLTVCGWLVTDLIRNREMNIIKYVIEYNLIYTNVNITDIVLYCYAIILCLIIGFAVKNIFSYHEKRRLNRVAKCV